MLGRTWPSNLTRGSSSKRALRSHKAMSTAEMAIAVRPARPRLRIEWTKSSHVPCKSSASRPGKSLNCSPPHTSGSAGYDHHLRLVALHELLRPSKLDPDHHPREKSSARARYNPHVRTLKLVLLNRLRQLGRTA